MNAATVALALSLSALVNINSGSGNTSGIDQVQSWVGSELKSAGFEFTFEKHLLVATLKGDDKVITLVAHADTVFAPESKFQKYIENGEMATGPGVVDDKGGLVVAVEGLKRFLKDHKSKHTLRFISSPAEETGSQGLKEIFKKFGEDSWMVLGFEPSLENGSIVSSRRGARWYHITTVGKQAHSGRAHKDGINACVDLAAKLVKISKLTDYKRDTTVSVGRLEGGQDKYNIVCGKAEAKIDARFETIAERDKLDSKIRKILSEKDVEGAKTSFTLDEDSPPFSAGSESRPVLEKYLAAVAKAEGHKVKAEASGGGADANSFVRPGLIVFDGLGAVGGGLHTELEYIRLPSLDTRAEALKNFLVELN